MNQIYLYNIPNPCIVKIQASKSQPLKYQKQKQDENRIIREIAQSSKTDTTWLFDMYLRTPN